MVATVVRSTFRHPDTETTWAQLERVSLQLQEKFPAVAAMLLDAARDTLAFTEALAATSITTDATQEVVPTLNAA